MADLHMTDFYRDTARILVQLYNRFPNPGILYVDDISGPDSPDEFGLPAPRFQACFNTMIWLAEAGFIQYSAPIRQEALDGVTLSHKGLVILFSQTLALSASDLHFQNEESTIATETPLSHVEWLKMALASQSSRIIEEAVQTVLAHPLLAG